MDGRLIFPNWTTTSVTSAVGKGMKKQQSLPRKRHHVITPAQGYYQWSEGGQADGYKAFPDLFRIEKEDEWIYYPSFKTYRQ